MRALKPFRLLPPLALLLAGLLSGCRTAPAVDGAAVLAPAAPVAAPATVTAPPLVPTPAPAPVPVPERGSFPRVEIAKKQALIAARTPPAPAPAAPVAPAPVLSPLPAPVGPAPVFPAPVAAVPEAAIAPVASGVVGGQNQAAGAANLLLEVYRLRPLDQVIVNMRFPLQQQTEDVVDERGFITLPLLGEVRAAGLTTSELEKEIGRLYVDNKFYNRVIVTVLVPTLNYTISGEVNRPGRYEIRGTVTLMQAIAEGGNFTEFADKKKIQIIRAGQVTEKNYFDILRDPRQDVEVLPRDSIRVPRGW